MNHQKYPSALHPILPELLECVSSIIVVLDHQGAIVWMNKPGLQSTGYKLDEIINKPIFETLILPDQREEIKNVFKDLSNLDLHRTYENHWLSKDGEKRFYHFTNRVIRENNEIKFVVSNGVDITDEHLFLEKLRENELHYRQLFDFVPVSIWIEDFSQVKIMLWEAGLHLLDEPTIYLYNNPDFVKRCAKAIKIVDVNQQSLDIYGAKNKDELINGVFVNMTPSSVQAIQRQLICILRGERAISSEIRSYKINGEPFDILFSWYVPIEYKQTYERVYITITDITEQKQIEDQIRKSQKMEAIGRLSSGIAHDFNNILTSILLNTEILHASVDAESPLNNEIRAIVDSVGIAREIVEQLLVFGRDNQPKPVVFGVKPIFEKTTKWIARLIKPNIIFKTVVCFDASYMYGNPAKLEQVLMNVILNASDAIHAKGEINVVLCAVSVNETYKCLGKCNTDITEVLEKRRLPQGEYVVIHVGDTGAGMSHDVMEHIFEPFFTTKDKGKGTGLGLATTYAIIDEFGGQIYVDSKLGKGSDFYILLPRYISSEIEH